MARGALQRPPASGACQPAPSPAPRARGRRPAAARGAPRARLLGPAQHQRAPQAEQAAAFELGVGGERQVEEHPVVQRDRAAQRAHHRQHEGVLPLVAELVEDLVVLARLERVDRQRALAARLLALEADVDEELHLGLFAQPGQQVTRVVADPRPRTRRRGDEGDLHRVATRSGPRRRAR
ncbi:MAG: hypothetical protein H6828_02655 [Planctomycetes bacterium]|nr:hypothetical protein [Planctomycetota bacterium]